MPRVESATLCLPGWSTDIQSTQLGGARHRELGQLRLITSPSDSFPPLDPLHASKVPAGNSWNFFWKRQDKEPRSLWDLVRRL